MTNGSQNSDLVDGVFNLLLTEVVQLDFLEGVVLSVLVSLDLEHM